MSSLPQLDPLDRRLCAFRTDLADIALQGKVEAQEFVGGYPARISVAFTDMRPEPDRKCGIDTQLLFGETVQVFDEKNDWFWVKAHLDGYVGWIEKQVVDDQVREPTHKVCAQRTFLYPGPDMKLPHKGMRSLGSRLQIVDETETRGTRYSILASGEAVISKHVCGISEYSKDYVSVAESLIGTPYLWAGTTAFGLDCSGLVKLSMLMTGKHVLRDSDMQAATIGSEIEAGSSYGNLVRGDLVFWRGHVGICQGNGNFLHANGHTMNALSEPLSDAIKRIARMFEKPIGFRRP